MIVLLTVTGCSGNINESSNISESSDTSSSIEQSYTQDYSIELITPIDLFDTFYMPESDLENRRLMKTESVIDKVRAEAGIYIMTSPVGSTMVDCFNNYDNNNKVYISIVRHQYIESHRAIGNYFSINFWEYLNDVFISDLNLLSDGKLTAEDILYKYGTHVVYHSIISSLFTLDMKISSNELSFSDLIFINDFILYYSDDTSESDIDKYSTFIDNYNILLKISTHKDDSSYLEILRNFNNAEFELVPMISSSGYFPIWELIEVENHSLAYQLERAYNRLI